MMIRKTVLAVPFVAFAIACGGSSAPEAADASDAAAEEAPAEEASDEKA